MLSTNMTYPSTKDGFFINLFTKAAQNYFHDHCKKEISFKHLTDILVNEYHSVARHLGVQPNLEILTLDGLMEDRVITNDSTGLTKIVELINMLAPNTFQTSDLAATR